PRQHPGNRRNSVGRGIGLCAKLGHSPWWLAPRGLIDATETCRSPAQKDKEENDPRPLPPLPRVVRVGRRDWFAQRLGPQARGEERVVDLFAGPAQVERLDAPVGDVDDVGVTAVV